MLYRMALIILSILLAIGAFRFCNGEETPEAKDVTAIDLPSTLEEARARATLLHEALNGALQVIHRDFFLEDESRVIPSTSLEDVFKAIEKSHHVELKWLIVETDIVNVDHKPDNEFDLNAANSLAKGALFYEEQNSGRYSYAGSIRLASQCLKCHVQNRKDTKPRTAGLVILMPMRGN
ncbi:MAG: DUF3365 domain-containing protein [Planctomycetaceae bacterium]